MKFIDRDEPLAFLQRQYTEHRAQFIAIYGKRRVGKTALVKQFFADKPHIYFLADKTSAHDQLRTLSTKIGEFYQDSFLIERGFGTWEQVFAYLKTKEQFVWIIDEFPYLVESDPAIPSLFQKGWDEYLKESKVFLILLGSSIGMMETEVLGYRSPLYGRRTGQLLLHPLGFSEARQFFPRLNFEEALTFYAICGGVPAYLLEFKPQFDVWTNLRDRVLSPATFLYPEPEFILREELREPRNYFAILKAMAAGKTKIGELVNDTGFPKSKLSKYLSVLTDLKIVEREVPVTEEKPDKSKRGIYQLTDYFFRFWFEFVFPNRSELESGAVETVLKKIRQGFPLYVSTVYESVAKESVLTWSRQGRLPFHLNRVGRYWEKEFELDLVGLGEENDVALFGEAKWTNKPLSLGIYEQLKQKAQQVAWKKETRHEYYILFSRSGFSDELKTQAKREALLLVEGDRLSPKLPS
jgi:AAA+ ATPase superfamily predicted ATPase